MRLLLGALLVAAPAAASAQDELPSLPAQVMMGQPYAGDQAASRICFVNARDRSVRILWLSFEGKPVPYGELAPGRELIQPTYVAHRWLVEDAEDRQPLHVFISTRSAARDRGAMQIALIR